MWDKNIVECMNRSRGLVWHLTKSFQKGERLNQKLKMSICKLGDVCKQSSLTQTYRRWRSGAEVRAAWQFFCDLLEKKLF